MTTTTTNYLATTNNATTNPAAAATVDEQTTRRRRRVGEQTKGTDKGRLLLLSQKLKSILEKKTREFLGREAREARSGSDSKSKPKILINHLEMESELIVVENKYKLLGRHQFNNDNNNNNNNSIDNHHQKSFQRLSTKMFKHSSSSSEAIKLTRPPHLSAQLASILIGTTFSFMILISLISCLATSANCAPVVVTTPTSTKEENPTLKPIASVIAATRAPPAAAAVALLQQQEGEHLAEDLENSAASLLASASNLVLTREDEEALLLLRLFELANRPSNHQEQQVMANNHDEHFADDDGEDSSLVTQTILLVPFETKATMKQNMNIKKQPSAGRRLIKRSGISDQRLAEIQMIRALKKQLERASKMTTSNVNSGDQQSSSS